MRRIALVVHGGAWVRHVAISPLLSRSKLVHTHACIPRLSLTVFARLLLLICAVFGGESVVDAFAQASLAGVQRAAAAGYDVLKQGGSALDAVEAAVRILEDDPAFDAGTGSVLNALGNVVSTRTVPRVYPTNSFALMTGNGRLDHGWHNPAVRLCGVCEWSQESCDAGAPSDGPDATLLTRWRWSQQIRRRARRANRPI